MKIFKGDKVKVIYGADRGKEGTVSKVFSAKSLVVVSGVNIVKKHLKARNLGIVEVVKPISLSQVAVVCSKCQKETRVGFERQGGKKVRVCKRCRSKL